jgi:hypothetical protein
MAEIALEAAEALKRNSRKKLISLQKLEDTRAEFRGRVERNLSHLPDFDPAEEVRRSKGRHFPVEQFEVGGLDEFWVPREFKLDVTGAGQRGTRAGIRVVPRKGRRNLRSGRFAKQASYSRQPKR